VTLPRTPCHRLPLIPVTASSLGSSRRTDRSGRSGTWNLAEQTERIHQVSRTLGIEHLLARFPRELSNGQRQRTALGRVLVRPAEVYLLDEPLSHLDAKLRAAMRAELKQLGEMVHTTTLYVTHDYQEALALGDRVGVLRAGRLVQVGTPAQVWAEPIDTFVARAFGQPEMNLFDARVAAGVARTPGGQIEVGVPADSDARVRLGIRPRDLELTDAPGSDAGLTLRGRIFLAERLGRSVELSVDVGGDSVIVVTTDRRAREGGQVRLFVRWERVHVFADGPPGADTARLGHGRPLGADVVAGSTGGAR
jgi:multiple sugar transport system ATP-binding protein